MYCRAEHVHFQAAKTACETPVARYAIDRIQRPEKGSFSHLDDLLISITKDPKPTKRCKAERRKRPSSKRHRRGENAAKSFATLFPISPQKSFVSHELISLARAGLDSPCRNFDWTASSRCEEFQTQKTRQRRIELAHISDRE